MTVLMSIPRYHGLWGPALSAVDRADEDSTQDSWASDVTTCLPRVSLSVHTCSLCLVFSVFSVVLYKFLILWQAKLVIVLFTFLHTIRRRVLNQKHVVGLPHQLGTAHKVKHLFSNLSYSYRILVYLPISLTLWFICCNLKFLTKIIHF